MRTRNEKLRLVFRLSVREGYNLQELLNFLEDQEFQTDADALIVDHKVASDNIKPSKTIVDIPIELTFRLHGKTDIHMALNGLVDPFESGSVDSQVLTYKIMEVLEIFEEQSQSIPNNAKEEIKDPDRDVFETGDLIEIICPNPSCNRRIVYLEDCRTRLPCKYCGYMIDLEKLNSSVDDELEQYE